MRFSLPNLRDLATIIGNPQLWRHVHSARQVGLETLLDYQRLAMLAAAVRCTRHLEADAIEFGSYRGGSAAVVALALDGTRILHICDSFLGLPAITWQDNFHRAGDFANTSEAQVSQGLEVLGVHFQIHSGFFCETLPHLDHLRFSLAHIDVDLYQSVKDCLVFCYQRMVPGGIIILDDYGAPTCQGAKLAADEFFSDKPENIIPLSSTSHGVWIGSSGEDLFERLRPHLGWVAALPTLGSIIFRR